MGLPLDALRAFDRGFDAGGYWLTRLKSRRATGAMRGFRDCLTAQFAP